MFIIEAEKYKYIQSDIGIFPVMFHRVGNLRWRQNDINRFNQKPKTPYMALKWKFVRANLKLDCKLIKKYVIL